MNIANLEYHRLKRIEEMYEAYKIAEELQPFVDLFANSLATMAAYTPEKDWPKEFHLAMNAAASKYPELHKIYIQMHKGVHST